MPCLPRAVKPVQHLVGACDQAFHRVAMFRETRNGCGERHGDGVVVIVHTRIGELNAQLFNTRPRRLP